MTLNDFLTDPGTGSWADEMSDMPSARSAESDRSPFGALSKQPPAMFPTLLQPWMDLANVLQFGVDRDLSPQMCHAHSGCHFE
ncbi:hypothetical protein BC937DRAFT_86360 [Endogone sp. FLAS-F59071]|nr:hypothetical protein BC937DRAFT_86360 [Endogone sp. FLAS-F59071]|eukprot:RUS13092.1 hypothetical protein BC937DRAFT_86360 [Endogone sp. FLAS-F59071]